MLEPRGEILIIYTYHRYLPHMYDECEVLNVIACS